MAKEEKEEEKEDVELQTPPKSQDQDIDERLLALKEKSLELCGELLNPRGNAGASDAIKEQVEGKKPALLELLGSEEEFSAKVTKISGEQASLGRDLEAVCDELAQILESLGKAEICVQEEIDRLKQSLEEVSFLAPMTCNGHSTSPWFRISNFSRRAKLKYANVRIFW